MRWLSRPSVILPVNVSTVISGWTCLVSIWSSMGTRVSETGGLPGVFGGGLRRGIKGQYGVEPCDLENFCDPLLRPRHAKLAAALFHFVETDHDRSHARAVNVLHAGEVEDDLSLVLAHQVLDHVLDFQALRGHRDLAGELDHCDVGID